MKPPDSVRNAIFLFKWRGNKAKIKSSEAIDSLLPLALVVRTLGKEVLGSWGTPGHPHWVLRLDSLVV